MFLVDVSVHHEGVVITVVKRAIILGQNRATLLLHPLVVLGLIVTQHAEYRHGHAEYVQPRDRIAQYEQRHRDHGYPFTRIGHRVRQGCHDGQHGERDYVLHPVQYTV